MSVFKKSLLSIVCVFVLFGCNLNDNSIKGGIDGGSNDSDLPLEESIVFKMGEPSQDRLDSSMSLVIPFVHESGSIDFDASKLEYFSTGTVSCDLPSIENINTTSPQIRIQNCAGDGHFIVNYGKEETADIIIGNTPGPSLTLATGFDTTSDNQTMYVADFNRIVAVDIDTGIRTIISDEFTGVGDIFWRANQLDLNSAEDTLFVADYHRDAIFSVDIATGNRTIISDDGTGIGTTFITPLNCSLSPDETKLYVSDADRDAIFSVDLVAGPTLGDRTLISGMGKGVGPGLTGLGKVLVNTAETIAYIADWDQDKIFSVDLNVGVTEGDRTIVSGINTGVGPGEPGGSIVFNQDQTVMWAFSKESLEVVEVEISNGNRKLISSTNRGRGPLFEDLTNMEVSADFSKLYALDKPNKRMFEINIATGFRRLITDSRTGFGSRFKGIEDVVLNATETKAYVTDSANNAIVEVDIASGNRKIIAGESIGTGILLDNLNMMALNSLEDTLYVTEVNSSSILAVDIETGNRTIVSDATNGSGTNFGIVMGLTLNPSGTKLYVTSDGTNDFVFSVDLTPGPTFGDRTVISSTVQGAGTSLFIPRNIIVNSTDEYIYVSDTAPNSIVRVDNRPGPTLGDRITITGNGAGSGIDIISVYGLAINAAEDRIYYSSTLSNKIAYTVIADGSRVLVSDTTLGSGAGINSPLSIRMNNSGTGLYVPDNTNDSLLFIDIGTGNRSVVSE